MRSTKKGVIAVKTVETAHQSPPKPVCVELTSEELQKMESLEIENLLDPVLKELEVLTREVDDLKQRIRALESYPTEDASWKEMKRELGQRLQRIAALHEYRERLKRHWRIKEGLRA